MTVARVASAEDVRTGTTDPHTFSYAGGTPKGIVIAIMHGVTGTALTSSVSYGGVPLSLIVEATDTATEPGNAQIWFVGSGVPSGTQTVSIDLTSASAVDIHTVVWELSGATDLEVIDSDEINNDAANPFRTLQAGGRNKISLGAMYGGGTAPGGTPTTGTTVDHTHDHGAFMSQTCYETAVDNADHSIGWLTLPSDDLAFVAIAVAEVIGAQSLTGTLFTNPSSFNTGVITATRTLPGTLFTQAATFNVGAVTPGPVTLTGTLLTTTPTFNAGAVTATRTLSGNLFTKAPTFPTGAILNYTNLAVVELSDIAAPAVDTDHTLQAHARTAAGTGFIRIRLFQGATLIAGFEFAPTGTFTTYTSDLAEAEAATITDYNNLQIHIDLRATTTPFTPEVDWVDLQRPAAAATTLTGEVFQKAPTFNVGAVTAQRTITGNLFTNTPFFQQGVVEVAPPLSTVLSGVLFTKAATFPAGVVTTGPVTITGTLLTVVPVFHLGTANSTSTLNGTLLTSTTIFPTGNIVANQTLTGVTFQKAPTFPTGVIGIAGTLAGILYINTPVFFSGGLTQGGSFWRPNPVAYTLNPVAYVPVGPGDIPPWAIEVEGELFAKAPSFFVGAVS